MPETWYAIAVFMLTAYVVLDGFDFGAGALHPFVARSDAERRQVLAAIGPVWDGNEVWLLAAGGALFVGFPRVLASGVSGFYFAIFLVLWSLILRGVSIEFRSHVQDPVWRSSWDFFFWLPSTLLPVFFGAALGNLMRGVPLDADGWFELALFTDFSAREPVGILDWYTLLVGIFALTALLAHGAVFLSWKTDGPVQARSRALGRRLYAAVAVRLSSRSRPTAWTGASSPPSPRARSPCCWRPWPWPAWRRPSWSSHAGASSGRSWGRVRSWRGYPWPRRRASSPRCCGRRAARRSL
jgi:cytochrome d ubiquinol oxidase subunit II